MHALVAQRTEYPASNGMIGVRFLSRAQRNKDGDCDMTEREDFSKASKVKIEQFRQAHGLDKNVPAIQDLKREVELLESGSLRLLQVGKVRQVYIVPKRISDA